MAKKKAIKVVEVVEDKSPFNDSVVTTNPVNDTTTNLNVAQPLPSLDD